MNRTTSSIPIASPLQRLKVRVRGMVQGVGFRPFVYTLATELGLKGWVRNDRNGVDIEVEGITSVLTTFWERLERDRPAHAIVSQVETDWLLPCGYDAFEIYPSDEGSFGKTAWILPDLATCSDCLSEIFDPQNRRYYYPFTNCTHCGPRYSILTALPYDRPYTTMQAFAMCPNCQQEYENPQNRRFHAQPNACSVCGPHLELWDNKGNAIAPGASARQLIALAADYIRQGKILALKGLGGFHFIVDARNEEAVQRLRDRKHRPTKPLAVMYPSLDLVREDCFGSSVEIEFLLSAAAPIVLLRRKTDGLAASIAPNSNTFGVMLPYTPLHHLLLAELKFPVVATSGNRSQEPICIDNAEALEHLGSIADTFLMHDRAIARPVDDSVVFVIKDRPTILRRARGYAPSPLSTEPRKEISSLIPFQIEASKSFSAFPSKDNLRSDEAIPCILAVGGHLKNTVALAIENQILVSQHLGDLDRDRTFARFQETIDRLLKLYAAQPVAIACDAHPDYLSSQFAQALSRQLNASVIPIQHHYAHVLSGMVDNNLNPPVLGIAWDGTGYGLDATLWGGEFLAISDSNGFDRVAHLRTFPLLGGDRAAREPRRAALGLLYEAFKQAAFGCDCPTLQAFSAQEVKVLQTMLQKRVNTPKTSSIGRLFDAIASLIGLCQKNSFEGESAMQLESILEPTSSIYPYHLEQDSAGNWVLDWKPMVAAILNDKESQGKIAAKFHNTLVEIIVAIAHRVGIEKVVLTGGCFQNRYLLDRAIERLRSEGFIPYWHHQIPPNDGGIAPGQVLGAYWVLKEIQGGLLCV
ncbi:carbamoyltransferase HypF [Merismopedia glauca CCAP 1448/3]|uniref:Carbamoyltransferase n=2 Tax=Merismopedia TaxID=53402 RepID=A0A2T1C3A5_9CYAN|nr:carbamoyltransferase HypF [Merismopedia glauca CCAP 1448/3]